MKAIRPLFWRGLTPHTLGVCMRIQIQRPGPGQPQSGQSASSASIQLSTREEGFDQSISEIQICLAGMHGDRKCLFCNWSRLVFSDAKIYKMGGVKLLMHN